MSQLQKKIMKIQRREAGPMGFGAGAREQPRAMLLAAVAGDARAAKTAAEAGADVIVLRAAANSASATVEAVTADKLTVGVWSDALDEEASNALSKAGCDFVVSTLQASVVPDAAGG
jgi:glycerophosphoryl diester phosphodiesterase